MALPTAAEARPYYQAAKQRLEDARFLLDANRTTGAIYLAGYTVECMLKALIVSMTPAKKRSATVMSFRSSKGHDYDWLKTQYFKNRGAQFPPAIAKLFASVNTWAIDLRYQAGAARFRDAADFLDAVEELIIWADGRL